MHVTEGLMFERALKNPTFANSLLDKQFDSFPVFLEMPMTISEIVATHQAPINPAQAAPDLGISQQMQLPATDQPNINDLTS